MKDAAQDAAQDVAEDVAQGVLGAAEGGIMKCSSWHASSFSGGTHAHHIRTAPPRGGRDAGRVDETDVTGFSCSVDCRGVSGGSTLGCLFDMSVKGMDLSD